MFLPHAEGIREGAGKSLRDAYPCKSYPQFQLSVGMRLLTTWTLLSWMALNGSLVVVDAGSAWAITDIHLDQTYQEGSDPTTNCQKGSPKPGDAKAGKFGMYSCDTTYAIAKAAVGQMAHVEPNPDFVLWLGDGVPYIGGGVSEAFVLDSLTNITKLVLEHFPKTPTFPLLGNHDSFPTDQQRPGDNMSRKIGDFWESVGWLDADMANTFRKGGYYQATHQQENGPPKLIVALNTNLWLKNDRLTANDTDPGGQFRWLEDTLAGARSAKKQVWILAHVPLGGASSPGEWAPCVASADSVLDPYIV
jgi:hypothetical protein